MRAALRGAMALAGATCLVGTYLAVPMAANAAGTGPTPFGSAKFHGYASGDELHLGALNLGAAGTNVLDVEEGFSGATTNSAGLSNGLTDPITGTNIQPSQASSTKAYGMGSGLEVGVAANNTNADANQLKLLGKAESIAPPISPPVIKTFQVPNNPLITGMNLTGESSALYDPNVCPLGQPISFGAGEGTNIRVVPNLVAALPLAGTGVLGNTGTGRTDSSTFLNANPDGTFGLASLAREIIAPITVSLPGVPGGPLLSITLSGSQNGSAPANPVTLQTTSPGDGSHHVALTNDNFLTITLAGVPLVGANGLDLSALTAPRVITIPALGQIVVNTLTDTSSGSTASANFTLFGINLALGFGTPLAIPLLNLQSGHMIASATADSKIICTIPLIKIAQPSSVKAGNSFTYFIEVPDPAKIDLLACSLNNLTVVDTISDVPSAGKPTFSVVSAKPNGTIAQTSPSNATVTFKGLSYTVAPPGQPPNPPLLLAITVAVPANSPAGTIQDFANATAVASGCNGGITGITNLGGANGTPLGGMFHLQAPTVTAAAVTPAAGSQPAAGAGGQPGALPRTGGQGGLWQPGLGLGLLALAGGAFALLRRSRRRLSGS